MKNDVSKYVGKRFNALIVLGPDAENQHFNSNHWVFKCDCGKIFSDYPSRVLSGHKKSCGCKKGKTSFIHGCNGNPFYPTWFGMMRRCYNKDNHNYERYGARGITVCEEWHDPKKFISWAESSIGIKKKGYSLERKDNNLGYSPENCTWATAKNQARNRRSNRIETINGVSKTFYEWCEIHNISPAVVRERVKLGWCLEKALKTPVITRNKTAPKQ